MSMETILIRLPGLESFRRYRPGLQGRCEQRSTAGFSVLGSYGFGAAPGESSGA
ncbi:hypothetical protein ACWENR_22020 [Micromonospora sp. NPDC004336]